MQVSSSRTLVSLHTEEMESVQILLCFQLHFNSLVVLLGMDIMYQCVK